MKSPTQSVIFHFAEDSVDKTNVGQMSKDVKWSTKKANRKSERRARAGGRRDGGGITQLMAGLKRANKETVHPPICETRSGAWTQRLPDVVPVPVLKAAEKTKPGKCPPKSTGTMETSQLSIYADDTELEIRKRKQEALCCHGSSSCVAADPGSTILTGAQAGRPIRRTQQLPPPPTVSRSRANS